MDRVPHPGRQTVIVLGALVALLAAIAAGAWGLTADRGQDAHDDGDPARGDWAAVDGGWLQVSAVSTRSMNHKTVPGMATMPDADPVPPGMVRIRVGVVMAADQADISWSATDFQLDGVRTPPLPPHSVELGDGLVPRDSQVSGGLVFDVPEEAADLALRFRDGPPVPVEVRLSAHGGADHSKDQDLPHGSANPEPHDDKH